MPGKTNEENFLDLYNLNTFTNDPGSYTLSKEFKESYSCFSSIFKLETLKPVTAVTVDETLKISYN
jgi:hypothetical protein